MGRIQTALLNASLKIGALNEADLTGHDVLTVELPPTDGRSGVKITITIELEEAK